MKGLFILLIPFLFLSLMTTRAFAAEESIPTLSVNGEGIVEAAPDRAAISIGVVTQDKDASRAQSANAKAAQDIINSIVALGVERKNINTSDYTFRPTYRQDANRQNILNGYEVRNTVHVVLDNLDLVGKVIDTALNHGANNIDSLDFGIKNRKKLQDEALVLAIRDARQRADLVARELGKSIVGVKDISINTGGVGAMRMNKMYAMAEMASMDAATPIEAGTLTCSASVHIVFILN
ncbi:MAG: SIMPL domain-containing protein [Selenomonadaceae bacterium]|nr:SIMPL domain-containing protein [Selenomonadaceae bacterium]